MTDEIKPGDKLYYVPRDRRWRSPYWVRVEKIGKVWITLQYGMRCNKSTLVVDGGGYRSPGQCYRTAEEWEDETHLRKTREALNHWFDAGYSSNTPSLTLEQCQQIAEIAGIKLPERGAVETEVP